jgi:hypothetical protein
MVVMLYRFDLCMGKEELPKCRVSLYQISRPDRGNMPNATR